ncbi:MAG TPA: Tn3 family transposase, partial [Pseudogracilibacillus sp.]|nr:Tn3 family transposase [Pseudogracilibacillus sp.]
MQQKWEMDELVEHFTLLPNEMELIGNKTGTTRLGFAILLKVFQHEARFPTYKREVPDAIVQFIAKQMEIEPSLYSRYNWNGRTIKYHRAQIRDFFGFREATVQDATSIRNWLEQQAKNDDHAFDSLEEHAYFQFRERKIEPPSPQRVKRIVRSALYAYEDKFFQSVYEKIPLSSIENLDVLLDNITRNDELDDAGDLSESAAENKPMTFRELKSDPGRVGLESVLQELHKLRTIRHLDLPQNLFKGISQKILHKYRQRVATEELREIRRHPASIRYTLLAIFFWCRGREITDSLIDLLIQIIHRIGVNAERKIDQEILKDLRRVTGKSALLYNIADAALEHPDGKIKDVLYPVVKEQTLRDLVQEYKHTGTGYQKKVHTVIRASYSSHYRRMVPEILNLLEFHSNNEVHRPVMDALSLIQTYAKTGQHYVALSEQTPIEGIIRPKWRDLMIEQDKQGNKRINRINYEINVLQSLREKLRCKEIWVAGADRYRNPDDDLPHDFEERRSENYAALKQPLNPEKLIEKLKRDMKQGLEKLDQGLPKNPNVHVTTKGNGWISVSPLQAQSKPLHLPQLKAEILHRWPMTNLLDVLKEVDLRVHFTDYFQTTAVRETLDRSAVQKRLILSLYGLGTNTGLKRVAAGNYGESFKNLLYTRRKFIHKDNLKKATAEVVNAILNNRIQKIWGEGTTSCASDAKKFGAWDQNLMTEWHIRYRGRGVMIYWHVEKNSTCIYSQLKSCSSSEVAAMIEGVLHHCTNMDVEKNYVDTHGQSEV